jgi:hypothetical protein
MRTALLLLTVACLGFAPLPVKNPKARADDLLLKYRAFHDEPWTVVYRWLAEQTGIPVVSTVKLPGRFTFVPRQRVTSGEFLAALNEKLADQGFRLVRKERNYILVPVGEE